MNEYTQYRLKKYGGNVQTYTIKCNTCHADMFDYQKDGLGPLLRCYKDRIINSYNNFNKDLELLTCQCCQSKISFPVTKYEKNCLIYNHSESRDAFDLIF